MSVQIAKQRKQRDEFEDKQIVEIDNKIRELRRQFDNEKGLRDELSENLIKTFGEEILKL